MQKSPLGDLGAETETKRVIIINLNQKKQHETI